MGPGASNGYGCSHEQRGPPDDGGANSVLVDRRAFRFDRVVARQGKGRRGVDGVKRTVEVPVTPEEARVITMFRGRLEQGMEAVFLEAWRRAVDHFVQELIEGTGDPNAPAPVGIFGP